MLKSQVKVIHFMGTSPHVKYTPPPFAIACLGPRVGRVARVAYRVVMGFLKRCFGLMFLEFEVTLPSMLYVWDVAGAARGGE